MILRFCLYSVLKNLRFADPFLLLYLLHLELSPAAAGTLLGFQHLVTASLEVPLGVLADRFGRRRSLAFGFACHATAFGLYALAAGAPLGLLGRSGSLGLAAAVFGLGEALRTGSHAAIILDHLASRGESERATSVIGLTRSFSKLSAGLAAVVAGCLLALSAPWTLLFWMSSAAALGGFLLMLFYPAELEGEQVREQRGGGRRREGLVSSLRTLVARPGALLLFSQAVLFESQVKLLLKYQVQYFLNEGLLTLGLPVASRAAGKPRGGAFWMGLNEGLREGLGGLGARLAEPLQRRLGGPLRSLDLAQGAAFATCLGLAACSLRLRELFLPGLGLLLLLTLLSNARKPVFVAAFDRVMDPRQRATSLSLHSQAVSLAFAVLLPLEGWIFQRFGLPALFLFAALLLVPGLLLRAQRLAPG